MWDGKQTFRLGKTASEAHMEYARRIQTLEEAKTIGDLLDRYALEVIPTKGVATQKRNMQHIKILRKVFSTLPINKLTTQHIYKYVDMRTVKQTDDNGNVTGGATTARHERALLSHAYTMAVKWGLIESHPFIGGQVRIDKPKPRTRYIEDWEIEECYTLQSRQSKGSINTIQAYIRLKILLGQRKQDMLKLQMSDLKEDGIHITTSKTGKRIIVEWSNDLRSAIQEVKSVRPINFSPHLFCTRKGESYINPNNKRTEGWDSMWGRFMTRLLKETNVNERFTEHDLRAKTASDLESVERAQALLTHSNPKTTKDIYRRKAEVVKPLK
jgi:integrase